MPTDTGGEPVKRKPAPEIEGEEDYALPPEETGTPSATQLATSSSLKHAPNYEPKTLPEFVGLSKLRFGQKLIGWCIFLIVALTLISAFTRADGSILQSTIDVLKLITTTALGFVFGRTKMSDGE
ncbi:hypothetical protein [Corynebacterium pyruviciproducens]|uniref:hypothetical protein n=1 Tax=Corynebacterium pyruviciproducens TaxID=598660 RepID=UPI0023F1E0D6|nr:hypothetical protein [Corynebacterium pyruviciproducens]